MSHCALRSDCTKHHRKNKTTNNPFSVRSREGRRNRAPPPRVRYNKDGKKINPQQAAAKTTQA